MVTADTAQPYPPGTVWQWRALRSDVEKSCELRLYWEANGDPISDDFTPEEEDAPALWSRWVRSLHKPDGFHPDLGPGWVPISWYVIGDDAFESAPFAVYPSSWPSAHEDFLSFFSRPSHTTTGEPVNWARLPVEDKLWRPGRADKGGFIQEVLGWKPSALQPAAHMPSMARAAGAWWPDTEPL